MQIFYKKLGSPFLELPYVCSYNFLIFIFLPG